MRSGIRKRLRITFLQDLMLIGVVHAATLCTMAAQW